MSGQAGIGGREVIDSVDLVDLELIQVEDPSLRMLEIRRVSDFSVFQVLECLQKFY